MKPQFIAMKIASVAPTTDSAPLIPHAHGIICGAVALSSRSPVGIGRPSAMPSGTSVATAMAIRVARAKGIAHATSGVTTTMMTQPRTAMSASDDGARAPQAVVGEPPAPRGAEAGAEQQREERDRQRIHRVAEQQHEPLQHRHLDQHEAGAERAEVREPRQPPRGRPQSTPAAAHESGPTTNRTTSAAEIAISVSSALRPLPNSIERPKAALN